MISTGARRIPLVIGLTGPIGCGKSTVSRWLAARGGVVIDADELAREVTAPGTPGAAAVLARFGPSVTDASGSLDRAALAAVVFGDPAALRDLEAIVHPAVRPQIRAGMEAAASAGAPFVAIEAIKLVEGGLAAECDEVWLVDCTPEIQRERLLGRGTDAADAERRIAAQGPDLAMRLARHATRRITTDGSPDEVERRILCALDEALAAPRR